MRRKINKKKNNNMNALLAVGAIAGAATLAAVSAKKIKNKSKKPETINTEIDYENKQVYLIGGGLASLSAAAYLIRDCNFKGENIHIFEGMKILGGSNDGAGDPVNGFVCRGGRMLNEETYENFWELFSSIPSLDFKGKSVTEEILNFDHLHPTHAQARLVDKYGIIQDVTSMGFNNADRMALGKLWITPEEKLDDLTIEDWFSHTPHFFETNFWHMWQTTFAFQKWSSLFEFKRYMGRMILEFSRINTLEGVTRTPYNQYDSVILPLKTYLSNYGVDFNTSSTVTDLDFNKGEGITVTAIHVEEDGNERIIDLKDGDVCIMTAGCMTDCATLSDMNSAPKYEPNGTISGDLWSKISGKKPGLGNPEPFFGRPEETNWESFTVTCKGDKMLKLIEQFSGNIPGSGALMTFKDSSWLMSIVVAAQPHFTNQPMDTTIFWGYGLYTDRIGDYVKKPMRDCTGEELLTELICQLHMEEHLEEIMKSVVNVIPCMMPYIDSQFEPRKMSDRPQVIPKGSTNFAMIGQFVEIPEDMVFTEEYSVRGARIAIYSLFDVKNKEICPVTQYKKNPKVLKKALKTSYR
ncbi:MAG: oleate hydratase [Clostridium sp.]|uniref:oleate hydratase n=1 Tax=Clostridium sp. TaxID=1506 RepID=UPI002FC61444